MQRGAEIRPVVAGVFGDFAEDVVGGEDVDKIFAEELGVFAGDGVDFLRALFADLGEENGNALPGLFVGGVVNEAQEGDEVADVLALEKLYTAGDLVGHAGAGKRELDLEREKMRTVKNRDFVERDAVVVDERTDALENEIGLLAVIHGLDDERFLGISAVGAEFFFEVAALGLGFEDTVGEGEDLRRRAVVGLDAVDDGAGVTLGERHDVFKIGAAPRVDALGVVADGHHAMVGGEFVDDLGLERVGVLILVDEDVAETVGEVLGDLGGVGEELEPELEQIVVIDDVLLALFLGVGGGKRGETVRDFRVLGKLIRHGFGERELSVAREGEDAEERAGPRVGLILEKHFVLRLDRLL